MFVLRKLLVYLCNLVTRPIKAMIPGQDKFGIERRYSGPKAFGKDQKIGKGTLYARNSSKC